MNYFLRTPIWYAAQRFAFAERGAGAGVDFAWEQKKLEARKMLAVGAAESSTSTVALLGSFLIFRRYFFSLLCENGFQNNIMSKSSHEGQWKSDYFHPNTKQHN